MKYLKTALLAGVLASVSTLAFAQAGAPTMGVDLGSVYNTGPRYNGSESYARAGTHVYTRSQRRAYRQNETTGSGSYAPITGYGSPD